MKYASIDIGSNTVLLLLAIRDENGKIKPLIEKAEITRLGEKLDETGSLNPEAMKRTLKVLLKYTDLCHRNQVDRIVCIGTEALRRADNSNLFAQKVQKHCGFDLEIISGSKEAELAYLSAMIDFAETYQNLVVLDIGGGSTELIWQNGISADRLRLQTLSIKMGSVRLTEKFLKQDPPTQDEYAALQAFIEARLNEDLKELTPPASPFHLIGLAGTVTTLAAIDQKLDPYNPEKIQGATLTLSSLENIIEKLKILSFEEKKKILGMEPKRADVLLAGAAILEAILKRLKIKELIVSDRGIRYGALYRLWLQP